MGPKYLERYYGIFSAEVHYPSGTEIRTVCVYGSFFSDDPWVDIVDELTEKADDDLRRMYGLYYHRDTLQEEGIEVSSD